MVYALENIFLTDPSPLPSESSTSNPSASSPILSEELQCPPRKRRKTVSSNYKGDEQKLLTYGGQRVHLQVEVS